MPPAAKVSKMSINPWSRKGRKRKDFSHLDKLNSTESKVELYLYEWSVSSPTNIALSIPQFKSPGKKVFYSHLMARSSAAASSAMRAEYPAVANKNGGTTLEG